ncbi:hypothetical protein FRC03_005084 [Tulasnella sp. 419]|nr:hypothetical protein FRC03_005084 [Tulasnella sp. 419]
MVRQAERVFDLSRHATMENRDNHPIIIVTGANGGIGFGICQRLITQLCSKSPPDAQPQASISPTGQDPPAFVPVKRLTLVLACRNEKRAADAKRKLFELLDIYIADLKRLKGDSYDGHAELFREGLTIDTVILDLSTSTSVFQFCDHVKTSYPYITHIVLNAGGGPFCGIDWWVATKQFLTEPRNAVTAPLFKLQRSGETNEEGFGWTWHCNVFGHYILTRELHDMLHATSANPTRILWTSSMEALPEFFSLEDWQAINTNKPYEATKYQMDLIGHACDLSSVDEDEEGNPTIRHFVIHPGITYTDVFIAQLGAPWFVAQVIIFAQLFCFYLARWTGSLHHAITITNGAISGTHTILAPIVSLPSQSDAVKLGSRTTRTGKPLVGSDPIVGWTEKENDAFSLLKKFEALYVSLRERRLQQ